MGENYEKLGHSYPAPYDHGQPPTASYGPGHVSAPPMAPAPVFVPMAAPAPSVKTVQVNQQNNMGGGGGRVIPGSCPVCGGTEWTGTYGCCAWFCCIIFFPVGILCCLCMRKKKCSRCGFTLN